MQQEGEEPQTYKLSECNTALNAQLHLNRVCIQEKGFLCWEKHKLHNNNMARITHNLEKSAKLDMYIWFGDIFTKLQTSGKLGKL